MERRQFSDESTREGVKSARQPAASKASIAKDHSQHAYLTGEETPGSAADSGA